MKPKLLLPMLFVLAVISSAVAYPAQTMLTVRAFNHTPIAVSVNGQNYGGISNNHELVNLAPGQHRLKVTAVTNIPGSWMTQRRIIYNGPVTVYPGHRVETLVDEQNGLHVNRLVALNQQQQQPATLMGTTANYTVGYYSHTGGQQMVGNCGTGGGQQGFAPGPGQQQQVWPIHEQDFNALMNVINNRSFESSKAEIARQAIANNYLTSDQVFRLMSAFSFESTRVEVAKQAFGSVVDPERYYIVYDAFSFESSISELNRFIYG